MSIMRCDKHDRHWDSDYMENCPTCAYEAVGKCPPDMTEGSADSLLGILNDMGSLLGKPPIRMKRPARNATASISQLLSEREQMRELGKQLRAGAITRSEAADKIAAIQEGK